MITILGEDLDYDKSLTMKMATGMGGGMGRWGTVCGVVTGGAMALGFCYGRTRAEEKEKREKTYAKVQEMLREFQKDFKTIQCQELIQLNLMDPADRQKFQDRKLIQRCSQFVAETAENARRLVKEK